MGSMLDSRRNPVLRSNALRILSFTRALYVTLHEDAAAGSSNFTFLATADDVNVNLSTPQKVTAFPLCTVEAHCLSPPGAASEYSEIVSSDDENA